MKIPKYNIPVRLWSACQRAFDRHVQKEYEYFYWCIDIHRTILKPTYDEHGPLCFYENTRHVLQEISQTPWMKIILWSSSHPKHLTEVVEFLKQQYIDVDFVNENPECPSDDLSCFTDKFYFDMLIDDKAGFEPETDWFELHAMVHQMIEERK